MKRKDDDLEKGPEVELDERLGAKPDWKYPEGPFDRAYGKRLMEEIYGTDAEILNRLRAVAKSLKPSPNQVRRGRC